MSVSLEDNLKLEPPSILSSSALIFKCSFVSIDEIRELKESESLSEEMPALAFKSIPLLSALILTSSVSDFRLTVLSAAISITPFFVPSLLTEDDWRPILLDALSMMLAAFKVMVCGAVMLMQAPFVSICKDISLGVF